MKQLKNFNFKEAEMKEALNQYGDLTKEAMNKYGDLDEDGLIAELLKSIQASKKNGTYDSEQMLSFISTMSPYLSDEQKERLARVISIID